MISGNPNDNMTTAPPINPTKSAKIVSSGVMHTAATTRVTIKKRGVDIVPDQLRKRLALTGSQASTIVLTRAAGHGTCLLVRPF